MKYAKLKYLVFAYLIGIAYFTLFRLVGTWAYCAAANPAPDLEGLYWKALLVGWRFDTVVSCYILAAPIIFMALGEWLRIRAKAFYAVIHYFILVFYVVSFLLCAIDIPYFSYFFTRFNALALNYEGNFSMVLDMVFSEPTYAVYFLVFLAVAASYVLSMRWAYRRQREDFTSHTHWALSLVLPLLMAVFCVFGMRGRIKFVRPIQVGNACFCNNAFLNQIGLNPVFTFVKSFQEMQRTMNKPVEFIDLDSAEQIYRNEQALPDTLLLAAPIPNLQGSNVVLVIMESMAVQKTGLFDPANSLTPCLDSIMARSLVFDETYSAGFHTYNGVYGILYSHPAIMAHHSMKNAVIPQMCGLPQALLAEDYQTRFFLTHFSEFDNMGGFLRANGFQRVFSQEDYPKECVVGTWGVHDHVMMDRAIQEIGRLDPSKPFFATILTCSDHPAYVYPKDIPLVPKNDKMEKKIVEYADWSIGQFMQQASQQPWFDNTIFVFIADHGAVADNDVYEMSLSYHHIPMVFYAPGRIAPQRDHRLALQMDLTPTLLSIMHLPSPDNIFGVNLLTNRRSYAYFSADDKIGVLDGEYFLQYRVAEDQSRLVRYRNKDVTNYADRESDRITQMKRHAFGMIQMSQQMLLENRTSCH